MAKRINPADSGGGSGGGGSTSPLTTKGDLYGFDSAGNRIPVGANGTFLTADSTQTLGVSWVNLPAGLASPLTTKGDIWVWSANNARLAVGTDGQVLSAASGQATGLLWVTPLASPLTTKGDLWIWSTTNARLAVGTDGQVLSAASSQTGGLQWVTPLASPVTTKGDIWVWSTTNARLPAAADGCVLTTDSTQGTGLKWLPIASVPIVKHRFMVPFRGGNTAAVASSWSSATIIAWLLLAGSKNLHIKRISLGLSESLGAGSGAAAQTYSLRRFIGTNFFSTLTMSDSNIRSLAPVCISDPDQLSSIEFCASGGSTNQINTANTAGGSIRSSMMDIGVTCRSNTASPRKFTPQLELSESDDSDIMVIQAGTGILIQVEIASGSQSAGWPTGFVEWEE